MRPAAPVLGLVAACVLAALIASGALADGFINGGGALLSTLTAVWSHVTGDCSASGGSFTCTKTSGNAFGGLATASGTPTGAVKYNGTSAISQAACSDLSNASVYCPAAQGQLPGIATNTAASAGNIGEYKSSIVLSGAAVTLTSGSPKDITTLTLTAGEWDLSAVCASQPTGAVVTTSFICNITTTANTLNNIPSDGGAFAFNNATQATSSGQAVPTDTAQVLISTSTTYHLVTQAAFSGGTSLGGYGKLRARRVH